jgi:hypothetical protein
MRLAYAFFAQFADMLRDDTVALTGGCFDAIRVPQLPCMVSLSIVIHIQIDPNECGQEHAFRIMRFLGPDGNELGMPDPPVVAFNAQIEQGMKFAGFTAILSGASLLMPMAGDYRLVFGVDGAEIGTLDLSVLQARIEIQS